MKLVSLVLLTMAEACAQTPAVAPYPPPGKMVDLGGYRVHLNCTGQGSPAVMIVGGFSFDWSLVQPEVAAFTRVCTYDLSGTAWSDPGPGRGCPAWVHEVYGLFAHTEAEEPYVLVGLSAEAVVARLVASEHPDEVAGIVMVDHAFLPGAAGATPARVQAESAASGDSPPSLIFQTPVVFSHEDEPGFKNLPKAAQLLDQWASSRNPDLPTAETTGHCIEAAETAARGKAHPLGNLPLVVVSTANDSAGYSELQSHLLSLSSDTVQRVATRSFHSVEISEPGVVIGAIREVVDAVRNHSCVRAH